MPTAGTDAGLRCEVPGCKHGRIYASPSYLKRHIKSKHYQAVQMSCGKSLPNHRSNIERHKRKCGCEILVQPLVPAGGYGIGTPMSATTNIAMTPTFDDTFDMVFNHFNNAYYPVDGSSLGLP
ncbi:hypothetical protein BDP81DRAFT_393945 [Colletotrichum phormii]|uniref:Uncharacterized protein n=1 Tax=Colletotrichum phormii TaxID=359342 RepID=A0AAJ0EFR0_9PEZI|nr:uncharacterized protein BDP81DRAFT_393945 [Colletotrichum phormii]KAK1637268.1 hypothetical protein BDP81DRAFT_393945 [Colletotrichum phormii]